MEREREEMLRGVQENVTELVLLTASKLSQKELDEESAASWWILSSQKPVVMSDENTGDTLCAGTV